MIQPSTRARLTRTPWRMLLAVLLVVGLGGARAEAANAQTPAGLVQLRGEYQGALSTLEAALAAYSVAESRFHQALDSVTAARESGDEGRHERALTVAQAQAQPVRGREDRVRQTTERVEEAREHLVDGLEAELERLYGVEDTTSLAELAGLRATIADMENELDEVRPSLAGFEVQPAILVQLRIDPTDGPNDILNKADLLERRAARHAAQIRDFEDRLTELGGARWRDAMDRLRKPSSWATLGKRHTRGNPRELVLYCATVQPFSEQERFRSKRNASGVRNCRRRSRRRYLHSSGTN